MKKKRTAMIKFAFGFAWMVIVLWSCSTDPGKVGLDLLPTGDLVNVSRVIEKESIKAYTEVDGNQRTDEPTRTLLGTYNDSIFGKVTTDFAIQLRLNNFPTYTKDDIFDSLVYYIAYKEVYGDTVTAQKLKLYELGSSLDLNSKYYQDVDLKSMVKGSPLVELDYVPKFRLDSLTNTYGSTKADPKDTVTQEIAFHLSEEFARKLMSADSVKLSDNDAFLQFFKGLYIEAGDLSQGGSIVKATGSGMVLYYRKDADTTKYAQTFYVTQSSARVSHFSHDYSTTAFASSLGQTDTEDSLIYLQTTGGLRTKILIPNLGTWSDSTDFAINQAELVFQIDTTVTDVTKLIPPEQLVFSVIGIDDKGNPIKYLPSDFSFSQIYYGGTYYSKDKTYRFNIARHLQEVIDKKAGRDNLGFYLSTSLPSSSYRRTVLKGSTSKTGIRLNITYSKFK
ncbi:MAG: DUF4270 family protein [Prolixibacteraceae bacterium]